MKVCRSLALTGQRAAVKAVVPVAMTDLCRACVEAEPPRARESLWTQGGQPGTDAVLAKWWGRSWGSPGDCREIALVVTTRLLQLQVQTAGLGQAAGCKEVSRGSPWLAQSYTGRHCGLWGITPGGM